MAPLNPNGSVAGNAQNIPEAHVPRTRSTFLLKRHFFNTHRFGEYVPHFFADLNKDEDFPINSSHSLRTYTLKSPHMQNVTRNKDYFLVPMEAILPNNWEKFFDNPVRGDDVLDDVGPSVENFWYKVAGFMSSLFSALGVATDSSDSGYSTEKSLQACLRYLVLGEYFYSSGNLLASLGCHGNSYCTHSWDDYFDYSINVILSSIIIGGNNLFHSSNVDTPFMTIRVDGFEYQVSLSGKQINQGSYPISFRHALQLIRDNPTFLVYNLLNSASLNQSDIREGMGIYQYTPSTPLWKPEIFSQPLAYYVHCNLSRLWAYQLSIAHYMTNDHIDFVYSAELYRQLIGSYFMSIYTNPSTYYSAMQFTRNGIKYRYDFLSAHVCSAFLSIGSNNAASVLTASSGIALGLLGYFSALFGYRRSLRYLDYFTGSRAQPLAVVNTSQINTNVAVNSNQVSVIDITKSIQAQRFLNSVNRVRHNFEGYLKGIFGGEVPAPDYHNPFKLAHTDDVIFGQETENTATEQMSDKIAITTNLRSSSGNYVFEIHTDRPCIAVGITSYEIARVYTRSMDRSFLHLNRFDWFNPFMQFTGDQPVYKQELGINPNQSLLNLSNFSYAIRHEEYKQWYHIASGGFCNPSTDLDNWIFVAKDARGDQSTINPDWIRSLNCEFDNFYVSLSGWSLGTYFHFIVDDFNSCKASRPMAFAPQILG